MITKQIVKTDTLESLALEYSSLRTSRDAIAERMDAIKSLVTPLMGDMASVETPDGSWTRYTSFKYGWSLPAIRKAFGNRWTSYAQPDNKMVRASMESDTDPKRSAMLRKSAMVGTTEVISLK